ncbi:hypothetical protein BH20ACT2_BH20ACT2_03670 [soil metagenome]
MRLTARFAAGLLCSTLLILACASVSRAQSGDSSGDQFGVTDEDATPGTPGVTPTGSGGSGGGGVAFYYPYEAALLNPAEFAEGCWGVVRSGPGSPTPPPPGSSYADAAAEADRFGSNGVLWPRCPATEEEPAFDPAAASLAFWQAYVSPPPPSPLRVEPGEMLVGLTAYLEIGGDQAPTWTLDNPIGPDVTIAATPRYVVDWGDGATTETRSRGVPHPGGPGEITHVYDDAGTHTITVNAYWSATWSLAGGGAGGNLPELAEPTTATLDLPIREIQAVIQ